MRTELQLRFVSDWTDSRGEEKKRPKVEKSFLDDEFEGSDDPRMISNRVREAERHSLVRSIYDRTNISANIEHL